MTIQPLHRVVILTVSLLLSMTVELPAQVSSVPEGVPAGSPTTHYLPIIAAPFRGGPAGCAVAIMPMGDSITHGFGSATMDGYRRPLHQSLTAAGYLVNFVGSRRAGAQFDYDRDNEGHPGVDAPYLRDRLGDYLSRNRPDIVLLHIGTNGLWKSPEEVAAEADQLLSAIYAYDGNIQVVLARIINRVGPPEVVSRTTRYNELLQAIADRRIAAGDPLVVVDMEHALIYTAAGGNGMGLFVDMYDLLHPNDAGYGKMAAVWDAALQAILRDHCQTPDAPRLTSAPSTTAAAHLPYTYRVEASGNPAPAFTLAQAPPGMTIDPTDGLITWTPSTAGDFAVTVRAANGVRPPADQSFIVHVAQVNTCPAETNVFYHLEELSPPFASALDGPAARCNDCPVSTAGRVGQGLRFDGAGDGLQVLDDGRFDWGRIDAFTVEFWLRRPGSCGGATFDYNEVVAGRVDPASSMAWWVGVSCQHGGRARMILRDSNGGADLADVVSRTALTGSDWHHVVAVNDPALMDIRLYVDGVLEGIAPAYFSSGFTSTTALDIGRLNLPSGFHLTGTLDEVAVYNEALTDDAIRQHHAAGQQGRAYCSFSVTTPDTPTTATHSTTPAPSSARGQ